jgi:CBS domain-containing protein
MSSRVIVLGQDMDLHHAMRVMLEHNISGAPVVDERGTLLGILSEKDCFRAAFEASYHKEPSGRVTDYMSTRVETIHADTDIVEVIELFLHSPYRRFPVVVDNRLVGMISRRDVLRAIVDLW